MIAALLLTGLSAIALGAALVFVHARAFQAGLLTQAVGAAAVGLAGFWLLGSGDTLGAGFASVLDPRFGVDGLSGLFLGTLGLVALPALLFSLRYLQPTRQGRLVAGLSGAFVLALALVLCARDPLTFLTGWELMTLLSATVILVSRRADRLSRQTVFNYLASGTLVAQQLDVSNLRLTGEPHVVAEDVAKVGLIGHSEVAVSDTGTLLYNTAANSLTQFRWFDRTGKPAGPVGEPGEYSAFRLSPDGRHAIATRDRPEGADLWLMDTGRGTANRFSFRPGVATYPLWSPGGETIIFSSGFPRNLFRLNARAVDGEKRLTQSPNHQLANDWSRDGRFVMYYEVAPATQRDLWSLPLSPPDAKPQLYLGTPFHESWGRFSPEANPRWVAYQSDESGHFEVYIQGFPEPRAKVHVSAGGGSYPQWGPGGRELFYVSPDFKLMAVSLTMGANEVKASEPRELFRLPAFETGFSPYDTATDGQRFLIRTAPERASQPLSVMVNWPKLMK